MKFAGASKPKSFRAPTKQGYKFKMKRTFGDGGMPMPPPPGPMGPPGAAPAGPPVDPATAIQQKIASVPSKDRAKIKKLIKSKLKDALKAQKAGAAPMAPPPQAAPQGPPPPAPMPGMKKGGQVESKAMVQKEIDFFKKKGAPKSMITHEIAEKNAMVKGGSVRGVGIARKGGGRGRIV